MHFAHVLPLQYKESIKQWLYDDIPSFDVGGFVVGEDEKTADLYMKSDGVVAGVPFFNAVFEILDCKVTWSVEEGQVLSPLDSPEKKIIVGTVQGKCRNILMGERTALNIISRASGVATQARVAADIIKEKQWTGQVAGTRKTTPGFRMIEKYALLVGGVSTHRHDLSQMVMLKDNHIWATGSIPSAIAKARSACGFSTKIEVECRSLEESYLAAESGADIIMLDNFEAGGAKEAASQLHAKYPHVTIEASGGITLDTFSKYFSSDINVISLGLLTHGYPCLDFSLKIQKK